MIPSSRPKLSNLYTLSQKRQLENHTLHSGTYLYSPYMAVLTPSPPPHPEGHTIVGVRFKQQKQTNEQTNNTDACFIDIRNTQTFLCNSNKFILKEHHDHLSWSQTKL